MAQVTVGAERADEVLGYAGMPLQGPLPVPESSCEDELESAIARHEMVVVCWEPGCTMHRLPHWSQHRWVSRRQEDTYPEYSHGICPWHYQAYRAEIERFIAEELVAKGDAGAVCTAT